MRWRRGRSANPAKNALGQAAARVQHGYSVTRAVRAPADLLPRAASPLRAAATRHRTPNAWSAAGNPPNLLASNVMHPNKAGTEEPEREQ